MQSLYLLSAGSHVHFKWISPYTMAWEQLVVQFQYIFQLYFSFRFYPPVPVTLREALNDDYVGGYYIPKGTILQISHGAMMRYLLLFQSCIIEFQTLYHPLQCDMLRNLDNRWPYSVAKTCVCFRWGMGIWNKQKSADFCQPQFIDPPAFTDNKFAGIQSNHCAPILSVCPTA